MYNSKKDFFLKGAVIFDDGQVNFKYKVVEGYKLNALKNGPFLTFTGGVVIETDRYLQNLSTSHRIKLSKQENYLYVTATEPIESNRKNMFKKTGYTGMYIQLN